MREPLPRDLRGLAPLEAASAAIIADGAVLAGLKLTDIQIAALQAHVRLLLAWNSHINLSGLRGAAEIARGHVLDALIAVPALRTLMAGRGHGIDQPISLLDLGSGSGFPGLPLAVALPTGHTALVESIAKKATFLEAAAEVVTAELGSQPVRPAIAVLAERAEVLGIRPDQRARWDLIVARAVGSMAEVAELGLPLARSGGHVVSWKRASGVDAQRTLRAEIARAAHIVQAAGGAPAQLIELSAAETLGLPGACLVAVRKIRSTPDRYPRSAGERRRRAIP